MKASARIQVLLDIPLTETWGGTVPLSMIHKEALEAGLRRLHEILQVVDRPRVVGEPKVTIVLLEEV